MTQVSKIELPEPNFNNYRHWICQRIAKRVGLGVEQLMHVTYYSTKRLDLQVRMAIDALKRLYEQNPLHETDEARRVVDEVLDLFDKEYGLDRNNYEPLVRTRRESKPMTTVPSNRIVPVQEKNDDGLDDMTPTQLRDALRMRHLDIPNYDLRSKEFKREAIRLLRKTPEPNATTD